VPRLLWLGCLLSQRALMTHHTIDRHVGQVPPVLYCQWCPLHAMRLKLLPFLGLPANFAGGWGQAGTPNLVVESLHSIHSCFGRPLQQLSAVLLWPSVHSIGCVLGVARPLKGHPAIRAVTRASMAMPREVGFEPYPQGVFV
jgi:hypothetical protein